MGDWLMGAWVSLGLFVMLKGFWDWNGCEVSAGTIFGVIGVLVWQ